MKILLVLTLIVNTVFAQTVFNFTNSTNTTKPLAPAIKCKLRYDIVDTTNFYDLGRGLALGLFHGYNKTDSNNKTDSTKCTECNDFGKKFSDINKFMVTLEMKRSQWINKN